MRQSGPFTIEHIIVDKRNRASKERPTDEPVGVKRKRSHKTHLCIEYYEKNLALMRKNAGMECHNKQLQRALDRLTMSLPLDLVHDIVARLLKPLRAWWLREERPFPRHIKSVTVYENCMIFTVGGVQSVCAAAALHLPPLLKPGDELGQTTLSLIDLFVGRDEYSKMDHNGDSTSSAISELAVMQPFLAKLSEDLLLSNGCDVPNQGEPIESNIDCGIGEFHLYGDVVSYPLRSIMISCVSLLARNMFSVLWQRHGTGLSSFATSNALRNIFDSIYLKPNDSSVHTTEVLLLQYMSSVENAAIDSRDSIVALSSLELLLQIAGPCIRRRASNSEQYIRSEITFNSSRLHLKMISLAWRLASGLQSYYTMTVGSKYAHMNGFVPVGKGIMFGHLSYLLSDATLLKETFSNMDNTDSECEMCYSDAITIVEDFKKSKLRREEYFFAKFWSIYFSLEHPLRRTLGMHVAIGTVFTVILSLCHKDARGKTMRSQNQSTPTSILFKRIDQDNCRDYFRLLTAFYPALFSGALPGSQDITLLNVCGEEDTAGLETPYFTFNITCCLFQGTIEEYSGLFVTVGAASKAEKSLAKQKFDFATSGLDNFCKICKNCLVAMSVAINRAADWRNGLTMKSTFIQQEGSISTSSPAEFDPGNLGHFVVALNWAVTCAKEIKKFIAVVKNNTISHIESEKKRASRNSLKSLPILSQTCEKVIGHIITVLRRHGIDYVDEVSEEIKVQYSNYLRTFSSEYIQILKSVSDSPFEDMTWNQLCSTASAGTNYSFDNAPKHTTKPTPCIEKSIWQAPSRAGSHGWGLYDVCGHRLEDAIADNGGAIPTISESPKSPPANMMPEITEGRESCTSGTKIPRCDNFLASSDEDTFDSGIVSGSDDSNSKGSSTVSKTSSSSWSAYEDSEATLSDVDSDVGSVLLSSRTK